MTKKVEEKKLKKEVTSKKVKKTKEKKESFFAGVKAELAKVKWPTKKDV